MKSKYPFRPIIKYIPSRYENLQDWQKRNQDLVYDFKNGYCRQEHKELFVKTIKNVVKDKPEEWVVCFVPASTGDRHFERYNELADYIWKQTRCEADPMLIMREFNQLPIHTKGRQGQLEDIKIKENFDYHKNFIVIDDLITTGTSFRTIGDLLMKRGALSVQGIIFAMTIHPNLPQRKSNHIIKRTMIR